MYLSVVERTRWEYLFRNKHVPGGSCHVYGETSERVHQETVVVSGRHLLARIEISFGDTLDKSVKRLAVYLECGGQRRTR